MLKGHLPRVIHHQVYQYSKINHWQSTSVLHLYHENLKRNRPDVLNWKGPGTNLLLRKICSWVPCLLEFHAAPGALPLLLASLGHPPHDLVQRLRGVIREIAKFRCFCLIKLLHEYFTNTSMIIQRSKFRCRNHFNLRVE